MMKRRPGKIKITILLILAALFLLSACSSTLYDPIKQEVVTATEAPTQKPQRTDENKTPTDAPSDNPTDPDESAQQHNDDRKSVKYQFAADGYLLDSEIDGSISGYNCVHICDYIKYLYNENGLCSEAVLYDEEHLFFTYDYSSEGRPVARYIEEDGDTRLIEEYEYYSSGELRALTLYDEENDIEEYWEYDLFGRAIAAVGAPVTAPSPTGFPGSIMKDIVWDEHGKLLSVTFPYCQDLSNIVSMYAYCHNLTEERYSEIEYLLKRYIDEQGLKTEVIGPYDLGFPTVECRLDYEYDYTGRLIKWVYTELELPFKALITDADTDLSSLDQISSVCSQVEIDFDYSNGISAYSVQYYGNRGVLNETNHSSFQIPTEIQYDSSGRPIAINKTPIDVYDNLNCTVEDAEFAFYGIWWCKSYTNLAGELHGGFAGIDILNMRAFLRDNALTLKITGRDDADRCLEYYLYPDPYGRQRAQKFTNGLLSIPSFDYQHLERGFEYILDEDIDQYVYIPAA